MRFDAVIVGSGKAVRMGLDKLTLSVGSDLILSRAAEPFAAHKDIDKIILVLRKDLFGIGKGIAEKFPDKKFVIVEGGDTRTRSVEKGLAEANSEGVLIHDAARPFVSGKVIDGVIESVKKYGSGIPAIPVADSVRTVKGGRVVGFPDRSEMYAAQTPQGFVTEQIKRAYALRGAEDFSDDSAVYARFIGSPAVTKGDERNAKITTLGDYFGLNSKIGIGYDIHRLVEGRPLVLGGVRIDYSKGSLAHSDGDGVVHALIDALLSAVGERDIGNLYPDTDPRYKDIDSLELLAGVMRMYKERNHKVSNVSIIIIADKPKLAGYIPLMKQKLSEALGISASLIGISAKTTENTQTEEAVQCCAAALVT